MYSRMQIPCYCVIFFLWHVTQLVIVHEATRIIEVPNIGKQFFMCRYAKLSIVYYKVGALKTLCKMFEFLLILKKCKNINIPKCTLLVTKFNCIAIYINVCFDLLPIHRLMYLSLVSFLNVFWETSRTINWRRPRGRASWTRENYVNRLFLEKTKQQNDRRL